jgi:hypothetical protein
MVVTHESDTIASEEFIFTTRTDSVIPGETLSGPAIFSTASVLWIASYGDDMTGDGTQVNPYRTISHTLSLCHGGETLFLTSGEYRESVRLRVPDITIRSAPGHWAAIRVPVDDEEEAVALTLDVASSGSKVQSLEIIGGYYYGIKFETRWDWGTDDRTGASDIVIEDCVIHDTGRDCIKITPNCDRITVRRCEIFRSGIGPGNQGNPNAEGIDNVNGDDMKVQECRIHDISTTGIYFKGGARNAIVERNIIENCGFAGILAGFDTSPEYFDTEVNPEYYESIDGIVRNNVVIDTRYAGIGLYAAKNAYICNNTLINTAREGMGALYFGITFQDWEPYAGRPSSINPRIMNTIVSQENTAYPAVGIRYSDELGGLSALQGNPVMNHNCYIAPEEPWFRDGRPGSTMEHGTFEEWKDHIQGDTQSIVNDPLFSDTFRLRADSPCIDTGYDAGDTIRYDIDNEIRVKPYDIGASEYR